jgi:hypothetical protein
MKGETILSSLATALVMENEQKNITFQMRCPEAWLERVRIAAERLNISAASYIRMVTTIHMDKEEIPQPKKPKK